MKLKVTCPTGRILDARLVDADTGDIVEGVDRVELIMDVRDKTVRAQIYLSHFITDVVADEPVFAIAEKRD